MPYPVLSGNCSISPDYAMVWHNILLMARDF
jgi:hypothetical protein